MTAATEHLAEHLQPILALRGELAPRWTLAIDRERVRSRVAAGLPALDPLDVLGTAGDLVLPFLRITSTFERCGLATTDEATQVRQRGFRVLPLLVAWLSGDPLPHERVRRLAALAAAVLGNAILARAAESVRAELAVEGWTRPDCPCCGGAAEFALVEQDRRLAVCARCDTRWPARGGCAGCGSVSGPTMARVESTDLGWALAICNACGRYLKERLGEDLGEPLLERLLTTDLDAAAQHRGLRL